MNKVKNRSKGKQRQLIFTTHAIGRFRERWTECSFMGIEEATAQIEKQVLVAERTRDFAVGDDGTYLPFTLMGRDGYVVLHDSRVVTILPEEWCPAVTATRKRKRSMAALYG